MGRLKLLFVWLICAVSFCAALSARADTYSWGKIAFRDTLTPGDLCTTDGTRITCTTSIPSIQSTPGGSNMQLQYNNNGAFGGASGLVWDNSSGFLGIGTTSPIATLSIAGTNNFNFWSGPPASAFTFAHANQASGGNNDFYVQNWTGPMDGYHNAAIQAYNQNSLSTNNGLMGLDGLASSQNASGTQSFAYGVNGEAYHGGAGAIADVAGLNSYAEVDGGTTTNLYGALIQANGISGGTLTNNYGVNIQDQSDVGTNNYALHIDDQGTGASDYAIFVEGGQSYLGGNVGIGTTAPQAPLQVSTGGYTLEFQSATQNNLNITGNQPGIQLSTSNPNAQPTIALNIAGNTTGFIQGFSTGLGFAGSWVSPQMFITTAGNVGIGTTSPAANLHVAASGSYAANVMIENTNSSTAQGAQLSFKQLNRQWNIGVDESTDGDGQDGHFVIYDNTAGAYRFDIDTSGNVGIGTIAPTGLLQVTQGTSGAGTISTTALGTTVTGTNTQFTNTFKVGDTITANSETRTIASIASDTSMTTDPWTNANSNVAYTLTGGTSVTVKGNGTVGIGTMSPAATLDVAGPVKVAGTGSEPCDAAHVGSIRVDPATGRLQACFAHQ